MEKVRVTLTTSQTSDGLRKLAQQWDLDYPEGKFYGFSAYGDFSLTLEMPPATRVQVPQLIDMRGTLVEDDTEI